MYYPYFRGKQYELITIRENADLLSNAGFIPIIEPVKESLSGLSRALNAIVDANGNAILIVNPHHGDHTEDSEAINNLLDNEFADNNNIDVGIILTDQISAAEAIAKSQSYNGRNTTFIHSGYTDAQALVAALGDDLENSRHVFLSNESGKLYRKHFRNATRILLHDGFEKRTNRKHPEIEFFSDLHATYDDDGLNGFGDFLIVGNDYSESGGPAYAVAIHITFIDSTKDDEMHIHHFKSIRQDTPSDPAGKFAEALNKLVAEATSPNTQIYRSSAIDEFIDLHERDHFPGLGYVKKLSMQHHIETLAEYFNLG